MYFLPFLVNGTVCLTVKIRKTLSNIAGSAAFGALSKEGQRHGENLLLPIASDIDKDLKLTLIPGKVDTKLLDPELPILYVQCICYVVFMLSSS